MKIYNKTLQTPHLSYTLALMYMLEWDLNLRKCSQLYFKNHVKSQNILFWKNSHNEIF